MGFQRVGHDWATNTFTTTALIIGSLAPTGVPFLTGFYSKDLIISTPHPSMFYINAWPLLIILITTSLTAVYNNRIIFFETLGQPRFSTLSIINENNLLLINYIRCLLKCFHWFYFQQYSSNNSPNNYTLLPTINCHCYNHSQFHSSTWN